MDAFTMEIAGLATQVQPMFFSTREYFRGYLTQREPEIFVEVTPADLVYEQEMAEQEAIEEGLRIRKFTDPFLERATVQRKIAYALLSRNTILLHGSTVAVDGAAYLFTAPCGTGKSTHTKFWRETFGQRAVMVNDDKAFLQITETGILAYGSPWSGKHGLETNVCLPLKGICFLSRGVENVIHKTVKETCLGELLHQTMIPEDPEGRKIAIDLVERLAEKTLLWEMACTKDPAAALVSYQAMSNI